MDSGSEGTERSGEWEASGAATYLLPFTNVAALLPLAAAVIGYPIDSSDWDALRFGFQGTDLGRNAVAIFLDRNAECQ